MMKQIALVLVVSAAVLTPAMAQQWTHAPPAGATTCPDGNTHCFHHGICLPKDDADEGYDSENITYKCNCTASDVANQNIHMGKSCQYKASQICHAEGLDGLPEWFTPPGPGSTTPTLDHPPELPFVPPVFPGVSFCMNGGTCNKILPAMHNGAPDQNQQQQHVGCQCQNGWSGAHCQQNDGDSKAFVVCPDNDTKCFNGSTCAVSTNNATNNAQSQEQWYCDCTAANQEHGTVFVGAQCEYHLPVNTGQSCHVPFEGYDDFLLGGSGAHNNIQHSYCLHGGHCVEMVDLGNENNNDNAGPSIPHHMGCNCAAGFEGDHCEHPVHNDDPNAEVQCGKSVCRNGGQCQQHIFNAGRKDACACPENFGGLSCEERIEICGDNEHACLNGGSCIAAPDEDAGGLLEWSCDCSKAFDVAGKYAAGVMCEHEATNICISGESAGMLLGPRFCTNHGKCKKMKDETGMTSVECACQAGFTGEYCEIPPLGGSILPPVDDEPAATIASEQESDGMSTSVILGAIFGVVGALSVGFAVGIMYKGGHQRQSTGRNAPTDLVLDPDGSATMAKTGAEESSASSEGGSAAGATVVTGVESSVGQDNDDGGTGGGPNLEDAEII
mmetsp:Transcript_23026/g.35528  ORF Transcript_23026/g.35528 Transcript_23026/m.35528 type:complete len:612 (+) Transcript_23026:183-2018(+)|eukprot:CAMPEP_0196810174 /NCGR_PEP_ID=MMETSP1362-20130617/10000_1 /TAXON_ID=163516 /ORGANISM="Leptocylindrus danicus, Strain CCMP1856" /LENGTH=611 /DNA_ID=CAMNT_0042185067 /DNA_START=133 /DNA_END=1968 /DNA_ORIENTATION=+